jgi:soluble lytic murein transglycosylase
VKLFVRTGLAAVLSAGLAGAIAAPAVAADLGFEARDAYYSGDIETAYPLLIEAGERWVGALAAFRLQEFDAAYDLFTEVAVDESEDIWLRSAAAFWAARCAADGGRAHEDEQRWLEQAAEAPWTFYGLLAEARLGSEPAAVFGYTVLPPDIRLAEANDDVARLIRASTAPDAAEMAPIADIADLEGFSPAAYPSPDLAPADGFVIDPALVYAVVRQESRFNPSAGSGAGAQGLMQLMPRTAAAIAEDDSFSKDRTLLHDPDVNLKLGQDYMLHLATEYVGDDMIKVVAAYNAGPTAVVQTIDRLGWGADPLLFIESLPARQTRMYVEQVMAGYWLYRRQFGQETPSLAALAEGRLLSVAFDFDRSNAPPVRLEPVSAPEPQVEPAVATTETRSGYQDILARQQSTAFAPAEQGPN